MLGLASDIGHYLQLVSLTSVTVSRLLCPTMLLYNLTLFETPRYTYNILSMWLHASHEFILLLIVSGKTKLKFLQISFVEKNTAKTFSCNRTHSNNNIGNIIISWTITFIALLFLKVNVKYKQIIILLRWSQRSRSICSLQQHGIPNYIFMWTLYNESILTAKAFKVMSLNILDRSDKFERPFMEVTQWEVEWASYVRGYTSPIWPRGRSRDEKNRHERIGRAINQRVV